MGSHFSYHFSYGNFAVMALLIAVLLWWSKYAVRRMFKTAPNGERLCYLNFAEGYLRSGSRPYIVPDSATERHLYRKAAWLLRIWGVSVLFGMLGVHYLVEDSPLVLVCITALWVLAPWLATRLLFASDLRDLRRAEA